MAVAALPAEWIALPFVATGFGMVAMDLAGRPMPRQVLPNSSLTHEVGRQDVPNWGAGLLEAFAYLGAAALVACS